MKRIKMGDGVNLTFVAALMVILNSCSMDKSIDRNSSNIEESNARLDRVERLLEESNKALMDARQEIIDTKKTVGEAEKGISSLDKSTAVMVKNLIALNGVTKEMQEKLSPQLLEQLEYILSEEGLPQLVKSVNQLIKQINGVINDCPIYVFQTSFINPDMSAKEINKIFAESEDEHLQILKYIDVKNKLQNAFLDIHSEQQFLLPDKLIPFITELDDTVYVQTSIDKSVCHEMKKSVDNFTGNIAVSLFKKLINSMLEDSGENFDRKKREEENEENNDDEAEGTTDPISQSSDPPVPVVNNKYTWSDFKQSWQRKDNNAPFPSSYRTIFKLPSHLNNPTLNLFYQRDKKKLPSIKKSITGITSFSQSLTFINKFSEKTLRNFLDITIAKKIRFNLKAAFNFSNLDHDELAIVTNVFKLMAIYKKKERLTELKSIRYFLLDYFYCLYDRQLDELTGRSLLEAKMLSADNPLKTEYEQKLEKIFLKYLEQSLEHFDPNIDLYDVLQNALTTTTDIERNFISESADTLAALTLKQVNNFCQIIKQEGPYRIIYYDGYKLDFPLLAKSRDSYLLLNNFSDNLAKTTNSFELEKLIFNETPKSSTDYLLRRFITRGNTLLKKQYLKEHPYGKKINLRVLTLNTFLLNIPLIKSSDVNERAQDIANSIMRLDPLPDIILLQEVFPRDFYVLKSNGDFLWPNSNDFPPKHLNILFTALKGKFHPPVHPAKLSGPYYIPPSTLPHERNNINYQSSELNIGPSGLVILVKKNVTEQNLNDNSTRQLSIKYKKHFFSRFKWGAVYNEYVPLSRGLLTAIFEIEGHGQFNISNTHLTTGGENTIQRIYQTSQIIQMTKKLNSNSTKHGKQIFGILGGDFNFEPYGQVNKKSKQRNNDKWPFQLLNHEAIYSFAFNSVRLNREFKTVDSHENILARYFKTTPRGKLEQLSDFLLNRAEYQHFKTTLDNISDLFFGELEEKSLKYDYLALIKGGADQKKYLFNISEHRVIFTPYESGPVVSDHYGVIMDLTILKQQQRLIRPWWSRQLKKMTSF